MQELYSFLKDIKEKKISYKNIKFFISEENSLEVLKQIAYFYFRLHYAHYVSKWVFPEDSAAYDSIEKTADSFYFWTTLMSDDSESFNKTLEEYPLEDFIKENKDAIIYFEILNQGVRKRIEFFELSELNKEQTFLNLPSLKSSINSTTWFKIKASCYMEIDDKYRYNFTYKNFMVNLRPISYTRFRDLAIKYNLNFSESLYFLINLNQLYESDKSTRKANRNEDVVYEGEIDNAFSKKNKFEKDVISTLKGNYGQNKILDISYNGENLESFFTDFQAFHLCKGIKGKTALYNKYVSGNFNDEDRFNAHKTAMDTLKKYGLPTVKFVLSLPDLPFALKNSKKLFSVLDIKQDSNLGDSLTFMVKNESGGEDKIELRFEREGNKINKNQISVKNITKGVNVAKIARAGKILPESNPVENGKNKNITPVLEFLYTIVETENGIKEAIIAFGQKSGNCGLCGRELTDPDSKRIGYGPKCQKYISEF